MKRFNLLKALCLAMVTFVIIVGGVIGAQAALIGTSLGISQATATGGGIINETVTTDLVDGLQPDLNMEHVSKMITKMRPAAVPMDTIIREAAKIVNINSWETSYYAVDVKPLKDTVTEPFTNAGTATTAALVVGNISVWNVDDTCFFPNIVGGNGQPLAGFVTSKNIGSSSITIQVLNGTGAQTAIVPNIADNAVIVRMAPAKSELDAQHSPFAIIPEKESNFCQNIMCQVEASIFDRIQKKEVEWSFSDYEELSIYDMRAASELTWLFGQKKKVVDATDGDLKYFAGGVNSFITKELEYAANGVITSANFISWSKSMFEDNAGSENRVVFVGDTLMESLSNVDIIQKQLEAKSTEVKFGITFNKIETNWGVLYLRRHPLFRECAWDEKGIVLDVNNLEKHVYKPMEVTKLDLVKSGQRYADASVLREVASIILRYPATHARIKKA